MSTFNPLKQSVARLLNVAVTSIKRVENWANVIYVQFIAGRGTFISKKKLDYKPIKRVVYNTTLIRQHLQDAGIKLTLKTAKKFDNWMDTGYGKAIVWLHQNAPWTDSTTDFVSFRAKYLTIC